MNVILMLRAAKKQRQAIDLSTNPGNRDYGYLGVTRIVHFAGTMQVYCFSAV
jgi:hypothetical protein